MQQHVGVAVSDKLSVVRHVDAAEPERPARRGAMRVLANSNPQVTRGGVSKQAVEVDMTSRGLYCGSYKAARTVACKGMPGATTQMIDWVDAPGAQR
jgi:hypothetical protein